MNTASNRTDCLEIKDLRASIKLLNRTYSKSTTIYCGSHKDEGNSNSKDLILDTPKFRNLLESYPNNSDLFDG